MVDACPAPDATAPLVHGLLDNVDCHVGTLVRGAYGSMLGAGGLIGDGFSALLIIYVALIGFQLMLGRGGLGLGSFATSAVKLGVILVLATQWPTYQTVVYDLLFHGPEQLAAAMLKAVGQPGDGGTGDVFDQLQQTFDALNQMSAGYAAHVPTAMSTTPGTDNIAGLLLSWSGLVLLASTLGVLLASKIVLGVLLALGPLFIALLLFGVTEGLFEGWLRASVGFALAPLMVTLSLAIALTMLSPSVAEILQMQKEGVYTLEPAFGLMILIAVFAAVSFGAAIASGVVGYGFRLPKGRTADLAPIQSSSSRIDVAPQSAPTRASRLAASTLVLDRREARMSSTLVSQMQERRSSVGVAPRTLISDPSTTTSARLGERRRTVQPRSSRQNVRTSR